MTRVDLEEAVRKLAQAQRGVVSREQARRLGCTDAFVRRRLGSPDWERTSRRVMRLVGSAETFEQRCWIAVLDAGHNAVVCGPAAARLWGLPGFDDEDIRVTRQRRRARRPTSRASVHEPMLVPSHHRTVHGGVPITTVERTIFDLMSAVRAGRAERALDNALARKLTSLRALRSIGQELCRKGRTGSALFRRLLAERGVDFRPVESGLEAAFLELVRDAGLPEPERQVDLGDDKWMGRVDFYVRAARLVVEVDSHRFHTAALDAAADRRRDEALRAAGFEVLRITEHEIRNRPDTAVARFKAALAERAA